MRRLITWCLLSGMVGAAGVGVSWSQDALPFARRTASEFAPSSGSQAASRTPRKSYYAELFGSNEPQQQTQQLPLDNVEAPDAPPAQLEPVTLPAEQEASAVQITPSRGTLTLSGRPRTPAPPVEMDAGVIYAEFQQNPAGAADSDIVQVRGERIVRPARRTRVEQSALTEPIAIPTQAPEEDVAPLFDAAPEAPQEPPAAELPAELAAEAQASEFELPLPTRGPVQVEEPAPRRESRARLRQPPAGQPASPAIAAAASEAQAPNIRVAWRKQGEVSVGRECRCELEIENVGAAAARNLEVVAIFSSNVRVTNSEPAPARHDECLVWQIAELSGGEKQAIEIMMLPLGPGEITTQAEVRYSTAVSGSFQVAEPKLALKLSGPREAMLGESATQTILITNPGTGVASNVQIAARIPQGLEHARGGELLMEIGALHPGETRTVRLPLAAIAGGKHIVQVEAQAAGGLVQQASCSVNVMAAQMTTTIAGPSLRYLGRRAAYTVTVTNDGDIPSDNVRVMHKVPEGFKFLGADHGGQYDADGQLLNWFVGRLDPGQSLELGANFECGEIGEFTHFVRATNDQGAVSDTQATTAVDGTPLLSMSVKDLEDPVETGADTAYEVEIRNEGSAAAQRIQLACELPEGVTLLDVKSPAAHRTTGAAIEFAPIAQLGPGESTTVRINVRAQKSGNLRFRAQLSSDSVEEPVVEEELTKFYAE